MIEFLLRLLAYILPGGADEFTPGDDMDSLPEPPPEDPGGSPEYSNMRAPYRPEDKP